jgi:alpha-L-fucosidase 2
MLMQSEDGFLNLLPALPDVWQEGSISGLRARGGFEVVKMEWKDGKISEAIIKSTLGGNLRLRVPDELKLNNGTALREAVGENSNPFYKIEKIAEPIISEKATITPPDLKKTFVYDIATEKGKMYTLVMK